MVSTLEGLRAVALPLAASLVVQTAVAFAALAVPVLAPRLAQAFGIAPTWTGAYVGVLYLGAVIGSLAARAVVPRLGGLGTSIVMLVLTALGQSLFAGALLLLAALGTLIMGLGYGLANPSSAELLAERTPREVRSLVFSLKQTGVPIGGALAGAAMPWLLARLDWRAAIVVPPLVCLGFAGLLAPLRGRLDGDRRGAAPAGPRSPLRLVFADPRLRDLALASFGFSAMQLCLTSFLVVHLVEEVGVPLATAGLLFAAAQLAGMLGRIGWGWTADRLLTPRLTLLTIALVMTAAALATAPITGAWPLPAMLAVLVVFGASAIAWNGVYIAEIIRLAPSGEAGAATGGAFVFTFGGVVAGPPLAGLVAALAGTFAAAYVLMAGLTLVSAWLVART